MDAEGPGLIGRGGYHAPPVAGEASDNDRLGPVFRMIKLFHRGIEGVQVRVKKNRSPGPRLTLKRIHRNYPYIKNFLRLIIPYFSKELFRSPGNPSGASPMYQPKRLVDNNFRERI
jgi:hypothetical protein